MFYLEDISTSLVKERKTPLSLENLFDLSTDGTLTSTNIEGHKERRSSCNKGACNKGVTQRLPTLESESLKSMQSIV